MAEESASVTAQADTAFEAQSSFGTISDLPQADREIRHGNATFTTVKEGLAYILTPKGAPTSTDPKFPRKDGAPVQSVFYNPIQQFNRDLSVLAIRAFGEDYVAARKLKNQRARSHAGSKKKRAQKRKGQEKGSAVSAEEDAGSEGPTKKRRIDEVDTEASITKNGTNHATGTSVSTADEVTGSLDGSAMAGVEPDEITQSNTHGDNELRDQTDRDPSALGRTEEGKEAQSQNESKPKGPPQVKFTVLDALSATGLRALRYAQELPFVTSVTAVDLSSKATELIALNVEHNRLGSKIKPKSGNALRYMYDAAVHREGESSEGKYQVIDLDPYGTAIPFLDAALQALGDGGVLCVTCTDSAVFASTGYPEKTYALYGGLPVRSVYSHEVGLRLVLHAIASSAARYGMAVEPLLSLSIDFYVRLFVRVRRSPAEVKFLAGKTMLVYSCDSGCGAWRTQFLAKNHSEAGKDGTPFYKFSLPQAPTASPVCEHCGFRTHLAGPMYGGPIHNSAFIEKILDYLPNLSTETYGTLDRMKGMLSTAQEELLVNDFDVQVYPENGQSDKGQAEEDTNIKKTVNSAVEAYHPATVDHHPFFFAPSALAKVVHCVAPSEAAIKGALRHAGYRATRSHTKPGTIKTDAPWSFIWEIMREWVRQKAPIKEGAVRQGTAGWRILGKHMEAASSADQKPAAENGQDAVSQNGISEKDPTARDQREQPEVVFDEDLGRDKQTRRIVRYQTNPRPNWGPMNRAKGGG